MPWEKKFDEEDVLDKAMQAFWQRGYDGTSMKELIDCMGINPGSIYAAFGDKKKLFKKTLDCYTEENKAMLREFEEGNSPRNAILAVFENIITTVQAAPQNNGCFLINSAIDAAPKDKEINHCIAQWFSDLEVVLQRIVEKGQRTGEIRGDLDAGKTARHLITLISGVRVMSRVEPKHKIIEDLKELVENILS